MGLVSRPHPPATSQARLVCHCGWVRKAPVCMLKTWHSADVSKYIAGYSFLYKVQNMQGNEWKPASLLLDGSSSSFSLPARFMFGQVRNRLSQFHWQRSSSRSCGLHTCCSPSLLWSPSSAGIVCDLLEHFASQKLIFPLYPRVSADGIEGATTFFMLYRVRK